MARIEWFDWAAYNLASANWVLRGKLALPQFGSQCDFDRFWLFNSPLMGLGPAPFYWIFGVGRLQATLPLVAIGILNLALFVTALKRGLGLAQLSTAMLLAWAFLAHRFYFASFVNQRYDLILVTVLLIVFWPTHGPRRTPAPWVWSLVGSFPLLHPAMFVPCAIWFVWQVIQDWTLLTNSGMRAAWMKHLCWFIPGVILAILWFGRTEALNSQFLPHLRVNVEGGYHPRFSGLFQLPSSFVANFPSLLLNLLVSATALFCIVQGVRRKVSTERKGNLLSAWLILLLLLWDAGKGFRYLHLFLISLAPSIFSMIEQWSLRKLIIGSIAVIAALQTVVSYKLDRFHRANLTSQKNALDFIVANSRPGDRIVLAPPFVLPAAESSLPKGRIPTHLIPVPFELPHFDQQKFLNEIRSSDDVFIGSREWFTQVFHHRIEGVNGIFLNSEPIEAIYAGEPVVVARNPRNR